MRISRGACPHWLIRTPLSTLVTSDRVKQCCFRAKGFAIKFACTIESSIPVTRLGAASKLRTPKTKPKYNSINMLVEINHRILLIAALSMFFVESGRDLTSNYSQFNGNLKLKKYIMYSKRLVDSARCYNCRPSVTANVDCADVSSTDVTVVECPTNQCTKISRYHDNFIGKYTMIKWHF